MVLENAVSDAPPSDTFPEDNVFPTSDYAPDDQSSAFSSDPNSLVVGPGLYVDLKQLPQPILLHSAGRQRQYMTELCSEYARLITNVTNRPARQDEINAVAYHGARGAQYFAVGAPLGVVLGGLFALRGRKTFRFPLYSPMGDSARFVFNPNSFGPLKGAMARQAWHATRFSAYTFIGATAGSLFWGSYGMTVQLTGTLRDPRMRDFNEAIREARKEGKNIKDFRGGVQTQDSAPGPRPRDNETFEMARQRAAIEHAWGQEKRPSAPVEKRPRVVDDASPTGGSFAEDFFESSAPSAKPASTVETGSSWDRIRKGAMTGQPASGTTQRSQPGDIQRAPPGDGQTSRIGDTEKSAIGNRQAQFDAQLQREREGFEERSGSRGNGKL